MSACIKEAHFDHNYNTEVAKIFGTNASEHAFTFCARFYDKEVNPCILSLRYEFNENWLEDNVNHLFLDFI